MSEPDFGTGFGRRQDAIVSLPEASAGAGRPAAAAVYPLGSGGGSGDASVGYLRKPGLVGIVIKNLLLTIITLGVYRFWARTRLRRYFWSNIVVAGEPIEYTGTGRELFVGFLIALAILLPLGVIYAAVERALLGNLAATIALKILYVVALATLVQAAKFRARRYRLSRTAWRGIRAGQSGSTWRYIGLSWLYGLLSFVTLGLAVPWSDVALERYKVNHSWFGESGFGLEASGRRLIARWLVVLALLVLPVVIAVGANWSGFAAAAQAASEPRRAPVPPPHPEAFALPLVTLLVGFPALLWYRVASFRYLASSTRLGETRLQSRAQSRRVLGILLIFLLGLCGLFVVMLGVAVVLAALAAVVGVFNASGAATQAGADPKAGLMAISIIQLVIVPLLLIVFLPGYRLLSDCWLRARIIRHLATTLTIENVGAIDKIVQSTRPRQKFGEGLADSFDLGAF